MPIRFHYAEVEVRIAMSLQTICHVCLDEYSCDGAKVPRALHCGHSICNGCLGPPICRAAALLGPWLHLQAACSILLNAEYVFCFCRLHKREAPEHLLRARADMKAAEHGRAGQLQRESFVTCPDCRRTHPAGQEFASNFALVELLRVCNDPKQLNRGISADTLTLGARIGSGGGGDVYEGQLKLGGRIVKVSRIALYNLCLTEPMCPLCGVKV